MPFLVENRFIVTLGLYGQIFVYDLELAKDAVIKTSPDLTINRLIFFSKFNTFVSLYNQKSINLTKYRLQTEPILTVVDNFLIVKSS